MTHQRLAFCNRSYPLNSLFQNPSVRAIPDRFNGLKNADQDYILGSCNGFVCLYDPPDQSNMIMYNPSIGLKSKSSPKLISSRDWWMEYNGFGYDNVNDKYKVLAVVKYHNAEFSGSLTKIYTFGEDSWRTIQDLPHTPPNQALGKYVSGTLNWVGRVLFNPTRYVITSFDLDKETYRDVLLPQSVSDGDYMCDYMCRPSLCVLNDCLCLCFVNKTHLVVWLMKEYGVVDSWTELMNIPREKLIFLNSMNRFSIFELLFISENGVVLFMVA
jgi:F-box interacting protein